MAITVTQQHAQFQAGSGGTVLHSITSPSATWATGDQLLYCAAFHHNAVPDRDLASISASAGTLGSTILGNLTHYTGASYKLDGSVAFAPWTAGATATLTATDNSADGADMWLTGAVLLLAGVDPTTPIRQSAIAGLAAGAGTSVSVTLASAPLSDSLLVAICVANNNNAWSLASGWTAITGLAETTWGGYHATQWINGGGSTTTSFPCAANTSGLAVAVYEIAAAGGGGVAGSDWSQAMQRPPGRRSPRSYRVQPFGDPNTQAATGTTFNRALNGSITPSGNLANQARKGLVGSTTPSGALAKAGAKALAGSTTPTGAVAKLVAKALAGSTTPTGTLTLSRVILLALSGSFTPSGALAKLVGKALAGSTTPSGALAKADAKALAGSTTPTGAIQKRVNKAFAGSSTPSGSLALTRVILRAFAGTITPSGALARQVNKALAGSATPSGSLAKRAAKALAGSTTPSGAVAKLVRKAFAGAITALGNLTTSTVGPTATPGRGGSVTYVRALSGSDVYMRTLGGMSTTYARPISESDAYLRSLGGSTTYLRSLGGSNA